MSNFVPPHTQTAVRLLRLSLWLLPAILLPITMIFASVVDSTWLVGFILFILITSAIGYFDIRLIYHRERRDTRPDRVRIICWTIAFTLTQFLIAPGVIFLVVVATEHFNTEILGRPSFWLP